MKIFISYRRDDTAGWAGRVYDRISREFGPENCFMDVEGLQAGENFDTAILEQASTADVALVMIGPNWLAQDVVTGARRLDHPGDWVRREVETALGSHATVIPLLVQGAKSPRTTDLPTSLSELGRKENFPLDMRSFGDDLDRLMPRLQSLDPWRAFAPPERPPLMDGVFEDVLHLHWPVDPTSLLGHLPAGFEIDTYGGKAWITAECVGVATGWYRRTPRLLPVFRAAGRASERLGLQNFARMPTVWWRTHVSYRGRPGWLALYLTSPSIVGSFLTKAYARNYPVNHQAFRFSRSGEDRSMQVAAKGRPSVRVTYRPGGAAFIPMRDTLESFLYHRNLIYGGSPGSPRSSQVEIQFAPWSLRQAEALELKETFFKRFSLQPLDAPVAYTATRISAACWTAAPVGEQ